MVPAGDPAGIVLYTARLPRPETALPLEAVPLTVSVAETGDPATAETPLMVTVT